MSPSPSSTDTELETLAEDREVEEPWEPYRERAGWQEEGHFLVVLPKIVF